MSGKQKNPPKQLPEHIHIESPSRAISMDYYYAVLDGKLWRKKRPVPVKKQDEQWELWGREGLPRDIQKKKPFPEVESVSAVYADGDAAVAVTPDRRIYVYQTRFSVAAPAFLYNWFPRWGAPFAESIYLPEKHRGCAFTRRSAFAGVYLEDPLGNHINTGGPASLIPNREGERGSLGLIHIYVLSEDGTALNYSDTGLPSGFGYQFDMPLRGRFIARGIAASCSIVFLIGETGRMYTAMRDFDACGNNPMMFRYTYKKIRQILKPGQKVPGNFLEIVNLPMEPWKRQPDIPLRGSAVITHNLTMLTTGEGNAARELRVQGRNADAQSGYYYKSILAKLWEFRVTNEDFPDKDIIDTKKKMVLSPVQDMSMPGEIVIHKEHIDAEILNFNFTCSPALVQVNLPDSKRLRIVLHMVDGWTMLPVHNPGRDGIPKLYWGTIELRKEDYQSGNDNVKQLVDRLMPYHLEVFAFHVMATTEYIKIKNLPGFKPKVKMIFKSRKTLIPEIKHFNDYLALLDDEDNMIEGINLLMKADNAVIEKAAGENRRLDKELKIIQRRVLRQAVLQSVGSRTINIAENFLTLIDRLKIEETESWESMFVKRLFKWGPPLIYKRCRILWSAYRDLRGARKVIRRRIREYRIRQDFKVRRMILEYLTMVQATPDKFLECEFFRATGEVFTDMSPFKAGEEFFKICIGEVKMRVGFVKLISDLKRINRRRKAAGINIHKVTIVPVVEPEDLPAGDRKVYNRIFKKRSSVAGRLIVFAGKKKLSGRKPVFRLQDGQWGGLWSDE